MPSSLGKLCSQIISSSKKSNISTVRTVPEKPTLNTIMTQVRQSYESRQNKRKKLKFKLKNLNTSLMMKNEILSLTYSMKMLFSPDHWKFP